MARLSSIIITCLVALSTVAVPLRLSAQVQRYNATEDNDYGIVYTLPRTEYIVKATIQQESFRPGPLAPWSEKYLGKTSRLEAKNKYTLLSLSVETIGVADTTKRYLIAFDKKTIAPFVKLMPNGVLYSINGDAPLKEVVQAPLPSYAEVDRSLPSFPREYSLATTDSKRAEIAATYLYEIREHAMNIVSGEVEQMPKDGESMRLILDKLRSEEQRTLRLFAGDTTYRVIRQDYRIVPEMEDMNGRTLFRLAPQWGIVAPDDLTGEAIQYDLKIVERSPELSPKEQAKRDKLEGIVYNMPGTAELRIYMGSKELLKARLPITQVGTVQSLGKKMLNIKEAGTTAIYFDPRSGALERVTTE